MRRAISIIRTVTYVEVVVQEEADIDDAKDAAIEKVKSLKTDGSTFKLMGQSDSVGQVLNILI